MGSSDTVTNRETSKTDRMKRVSGGKEFAIDKEDQMIVDLENRQIIVKDTGGNIILQISGDDERISVGQNERILLDGAGQRILIKDDSSVNRVLFDASSGKMKLSQDGKNVLTAPDDELIWSSDFNMFKIVQSGTTTVTGIDRSGSAIGDWGNEDNKATVVHGLGYIPAVIAFVEFTSGATTYRLPLQSGGSPLEYFPTVDHFPFDGMIMMWIDGTNIVFHHRTNGGFDLSGRTYTIKYYILRETAVA